MPQLHIADSTIFFVCTCIYTMSWFVFVGRGRYAWRGAARVHVSVPRIVHVRVHIRMAQIVVPPAPPLSQRWRRG